jgi:phosphoribosylglycinamide formyltransferase-1
MKVGFAVFASGSGTNLQALIDACADAAFPARIAVVISNKADAYALERARIAGIPARHLAGKDRDAWERAAIGICRDHQVEWIALAGFMRLVTPTLLGAYRHRVLNIHPALLPAFPGLHAQDQAHAYGVRIAGCTVHLVDEGTDTGPIVVQGAVPVGQDDTADELRARILRMEHRIYPLAVKWAAEGRISVEGRRVRVVLPPGEAAFRFEIT